VSPSGANCDALRVRIRDRRASPRNELGLVQKVDVAARVIPLPMMFKMYLLNDEEVFFGFYPVVEREVEIGGKSVPIIDAVGKDTVLFHHSVSDDDRATGSQYVDQARRWFDSLWGTLGRTFEP
jgi:hypothetical protein